MTEQTRDKLLAAAKRQFAAKGFYGASIAQIAEELQISKQALLYHFRRKEDLYAQVLESISEKLLRYVRMATIENVEPARQFENIVLSLFHAAVENPEDTHLLVREMLDNQSRADEAQSWYLVPFLNGLVAIIERVPTLQNVSEPAIFTFIYQVLGGIEYFIISKPTLTKMYGKEAYERYKNQFPMEVQNQVSRFFASACAPKA